MEEIKNRTFRLWAYTVSHNFLILRSPMINEDAEGYSKLTSFNIDIEFTAVMYIDMPDLIKGIEIKELNKNIPIKFQIYENSGFKVYEIVSERNSYYIVAGGYRIGKNKWIAEDRICNLSLEHDEFLK